MLEGLNRYEEASSLLCRQILVARRILGETNSTTLGMRWLYALTLRKKDGATLDDLRESVETLQETAKIMRQVYGGAHPLTVGVEKALREARATLAARETQ